MCIRIVQLLIRRDDEIEHDEGLIIRIIDARVDNPIARINYRSGY
jgi:hypothetical protein